MKNKKINYLIVSMLFFFGSIISINASNTVDFSKKGSFEVTLSEKENNSGIENVEITIYHVANAIDVEHNLSFELIDELMSCDVDLSNLEDIDLPRELSNCLNEEVPTLKKVTDSLGRVKFNDIDLGLYLVTQTNKVKGYSTIEPFLVMVPIYEDNVWIYDVLANPKTDIYQEIDLRVVKVWNTTNVKLPEKVTIQLYKGEILIDTVILNNENNWSHTWEDIEKSDKYSVKEIDIPDGYTPSYKNNEYIFTVTNTDTLPKTGQTYFPIVVLASLGTIFILLGFIQLKRDNR